MKPLLLYTKPSTIANGRCPGSPNQTTKIRALSAQKSSGQSKAKLSPVFHVEHRTKRKVKTMKKVIAAIGLIVASASCFASQQAHFNDARECVGTAENNHTHATATFYASAGEFAPDQFALVDTKLHYSFFSPKMERDHVTGGYVGAGYDAIYRANYLPGKDIFEIISADNTFTAVCAR